MPKTYNSFLGSNLGGEESRFIILNAPVRAMAVFILEDALSVQTDNASIMAVFTLETIYPPQTDNPPSKSVKIDGKTDG